MNTSLYRRPSSRITPLRIYPGGVRDYPGMMRWRLPLSFRRLSIAVLFFAGSAYEPSTAGAQSAPPPAPSAAPADDLIRLSDEEKQAIMDKMTVESAAAARGEMTGSDRAKLKVHGEVSAFVGSNGSRGIAGVAAVPLGNNAGAVVSFESSRYGLRR